MPVATIPPSLLAWVAIVLGLLAMICATVILGVTAVRLRVDRDAAPLVTRGREMLARAMIDGRMAPEDEAFLRRMERPLLVRLFVRLAPSLGGDSRTELRRMARGFGLQDMGVRLARSRLWWQRLRGVRLLTAVGGGEEVVPGLRADRVPAIRAQAAEWLSEYGGADAPDQLADLLDDPDPLCRFTAKHGLARLGPRAIGAVRTRLTSPSARLRAAALHVAIRMPDPVLLDRTIELAGDGDPRVRALAAELLAKLGGELASSRLVVLLSDDQGRVRRAACEGMGILGDVATAPRLTQLLEDPVWEVRNHAARALRGMGAPGELLLRRALRAGGVSADAAGLAMASPSTSKAMGP